MKSRLLLISVLMAVVWLTLMVRAAHLQIWPHPRLSELQKRQFETHVLIPARRGAIYDRNGKELAITVAGHSVFADPHILPQAELASLATQVSEILGLPRSRVLHSLQQSERRFIWLKRHVTADQVQQVRSLRVRGIGLIEEPRRVYPNERLAAQTLGFVGREGQGLEGLEVFWDAVLKGEGRRLILPRDARGRPLLMDGQTLAEAPDGGDLHLTLDSELQFLLERELERALEKHSALSAVGVILDAQTSEVLALANAPNFDVNRATSTPAALRRNRVVTDAFEPGSTLKTFAVAKALQEGLVRPSTRYDVEGGRLQIGRRWIREADSSHRWEELSVTEILAHSSNVGMAKMAFDLGDEKLLEGLRDFGFGQRTGIDFPGEALGIVNPLPWRPHLLANVSIGHGIATTPLQMAAAYAAIANGGVLRPPRLVKGSEPGEERQVLSAQEAAVMTLMLTQATARGSTGFNARVPGFPVAGKTGTAQKVDPVAGGYRRGAYIASFAGFVPSNSPRFVIYVAVDEPQERFYGSQVAAPIFARVAQQALRREGLSPVFLEKENILSLHPRGSGEELRHREPTSDDLQRRALQEIQELILLESSGRVPDLTGLSLREAHRLLRHLDVSVQVKGAGLVAQSTPRPGQPLPQGGPIKLELRPIE